jgi:uncharacterized membrane protein YbhN (UPF0104 family)
MEASARIRRWAEGLILALVAGAAIWALREVDVRSVAARLGPGGWGAIALLFVLSTGLTYLPSWWFLRRAGHRLSLGAFSAVMLASQALNATNPLRMGFPLRVYLLKDRYGVSAGTAALLIPLEGFMAIAVAVCAALVAAPLHFALTRGPWASVLGLGVVAGVAGALVIGRLAARRRLPIPARLSERVRGAAESLQSALAHVTPASLGAFAVLFLASDVAVAGILKVAAISSGLEISLALLLAAYCASYLVGTASLMPQGLGTRDAALGFLLHTAGATPEQAVFGALVVRVATTGLAFLAGIGAALGLGLARKGTPRSRAAALPAPRPAPGLPRPASGEGKAEVRR